jgi:hypothetical protein
VAGRDPRRDGGPAMALRREILFGLAAVALWLGLGQASACPFCTMQGKTLAMEANQATLVLYGKLSNANETNDTTDIEIETVVKDNKAVRGDKKKLTLGRFIDLSVTTDKDRFVVFCDLFNGKIDAYRGLALKSGSKVPQYIRGAMAIENKPIEQKLKFFFDYLDNDDIEISNDAYKEFGNADYKEFKLIARDLPAKRVLEWLKNPDTPSFRYGLYASMLGHCGKESDAAVLKTLLDDPDRRSGSGVDGILTAYVLLKPKDGWKYLQASLKDAKEDWMFRFAALRAVRFLHDYRSDVVKKSDLESAVCLLLTQKDIADLAIEDLRKWECWDKADDVLAVMKTSVYDTPIVKRAVLRYCLQCQGKPAAAAHVAARRNADSEAVLEAQEILDLEKKASKPVDTTKK